MSDRVRPSRLRTIRLWRPAAVLPGLLFLGLVVVPTVGAASPAPTDPTASAAVARFVARHPLLAGTVRADLTVVKRDGTTVLVHYEVGKVTAVNASSITIEGRDGKGASFTVTGDTKVRARGRAISISELEVGDRAMVLGTSSNGGYSAFLIRCVLHPASSTGS